MSFRNFVRRFSSPQICEKVGRATDIGSCNSTACPRRIGKFLNRYLNMSWAFRPILVILPNISRLSSGVSTCHRRSWCRRWSRAPRTGISAVLPADSGRRATDPNLRAGYCPRLPSGRILLIPESTPSYSKGGWQRRWPLISLNWTRLSRINDWTANHEILMNGGKQYIFYLLFCFFLSGG